MVNRILKESKKVLITSHLHPDGDAIGSIIAMGAALKKMGKEVFLYNESCIPRVFSFLPGIDKISRTFPENHDFDTAVILDCSEMSRTGRCEQIQDTIPKILNIDHHITNSCFGSDHIVDPNACSTAEIVHKIICDLGIEFCNEMAYGIYTGIFTDTGSFRFSNTNQNAFSICMEMLGYGVKPEIVAQNVYGSYSLGRIRLLNMVLDSIEISENGKLSLMVLTLEMLEQTGTRREDVSELINYAEHIKDVKMAVFIKEGEKCNECSPHYHVSLRSDGSVDVSDIASNYGGGGHETAAGFSTETPFKELKEQLMSMSDKI